MKRKEGWQVWVDFKQDHVIKTPKTRKEIEKKVKEFLIWMKKKESPNKRVDRALKDITKSIRLVKRSKIPLNHLAYPEFLSDGLIKQKRVRSVEEELFKLNKVKNRAGMKKLIIKSLNFITYLWQYGFNEKTYKITSNFGIDGKNIVLIDFLELEGNKKKVIKQLRKKPWHLYKKLAKKDSRYPKHMIELFTEEADKILTVEKLNKLWKTKRK